MMAMPSEFTIALFPNRGDSTSKHGAHLPRPDLGRADRGRLTLLNCLGLQRLAPCKST